MSTTTPFRELPGRAKGVLPAWELRKDKEEVTYTLNKCRGVPQNCVHDVSARCRLLLCVASSCVILVWVVWWLWLLFLWGERKRTRCTRRSAWREKRSDGRARERTHQQQSLHKI